MAEIGEGNRVEKGRRAASGEECRPLSPAAEVTAVLNPPAFDDEDSWDEEDGEIDKAGEVPATLLQPKTYFAGRYFVLRLLALGGIAEVYEAVDIQTEQPCALKILRLEYRRSEKLRLQMEAEARAFAELDHENFVKVWDAGVTPEGLIYFAMELLTGTTLHDAIYGAPDQPRSAPVPLRVALDWMVQIAAAVHALHVARILHRDLKPDNVFITRDGRIVILDLGAAKFRRFGLRTTGSHRTIGTPPYMSPEHLRGDRDIDGRSDVYALGHVFYELLARRHAFCAPGESFSGETYRLWQEQRRPAPLTEMRAGLPHVVSEIVLKALEKRREDRWQTCQELEFAVAGAAELLEAEGLLDEPAAPLEPPVPAIAVATTAEAVPGRATEAPVVRVNSSEPRVTQRGTVIVEAQQGPPGAGPLSPRMTARGTEIVETSVPQPAVTVPMGPLVDDAPPEGRLRAAVRAQIEQMWVAGRTSVPPAGAARVSTQEASLEVVTSEVRAAGGRAGGGAAGAEGHPATRWFGAVLLVSVVAAFALGGGVMFYVGRRSAGVPAGAPTVPAGPASGPVSVPIVEPPPAAPSGTLAAPSAAVSSAPGGSAVPSGSASAPAPKSAPQKPKAPATKPAAKRKDNSSLLIFE